MAKIDRIIVYPQLNPRPTVRNGIRPAPPNGSVAKVKNDPPFIDNFTDIRKREPRTQKKKRSLWASLPCCNSCLPFFIACLLIACLILAVVLPIYFLSLRTTSTDTASVLSTSSSATNTILNTTTITSTSTTSTSTTTTSTSTGTTSTTTSASTTSTSTSTTSTSTSTTTTNICNGGYTYVTQLIYLDMNATLSWTQYTFNYTAPNVATATLIFSFRNDPNFWYLDDVSVTNSFGTQLLSNGGFEQGTLANWIFCNPNNAASSGIITSSTYYSGSYGYQDGSVGAFDYLSQTFNVQPNHIYTLNFWLSSGSSSVTYALITISS